MEPLTVGELSPNDAYRMFVEQIIQICEQYKLSIGHEDEHGAFQVRPYAEFYSEWLRDAEVIR